MAERESLWERHPDYRVDLVPGDERVVVSFAGEVIADSRQPMRVLETRHDEVLYFPRADVRFEHLEPTDHRTFCPFKGDASYWTIRAGGRESENAVWSYEQPFEQVAGLAGLVAFYADRVDWSR